MCVLEIPGRSRRPVGEAVEDKGPGWGGSARWLHFRLGLHSHGIMLLKLGGPNVFLLKFYIKNKNSSTEEGRGP